MKSYLPGWYLQSSFICIIFIYSSASCWQSVNSIEANVHEWNSTKSNAENQVRNKCRLGDCLTVEDKNKHVTVDDTPSSFHFRYALSPTYLTSLVKSEFEVYEEIEKYAKSLEDRLILIRAYTKDYKDSKMKGMNGMPESWDNWQRAGIAAAHPLLAYRTTRRFAHEFRAIVDHIRKEHEPKLEKRLDELGGEDGFPSESDHVDGMEAILRLHYYYDLDLERFTNGMIGQSATNIGLSTNQIFELGQYATDKEYFSLANDWLRVTESRIKTKVKTQTSFNLEDGVSLNDLAQAYQRNIDLHDEKFESYPDEEFYMFKERLDGLSGVNNFSTVREHMMAEMQSIANAPLEPDENVGLKWLVKQTQKRKSEHYKFIGLCNGGNYQSEAEKKHLVCWYDSTRSAYFGPINPLKMELLNKDPLLLQIYEVIGDKWIAELSKAAQPTLTRAPPPSGPGVTFRTASYAWLSDEEIPHIQISRRIELITGLNVRGSLASEDLQIASYAYGAHVSIHSDSLGVNRQDHPKIALSGDRVSTFLIYLNEVKEGGYTGFPLLNTAVKPVKGSTVFWYTALKSGDVDSRMLHGACPVLLGHKWIATKWTNLKENFLRRPCDTDPYA